jgi:O-succinylbenzoic acid--CoA ligase
MRVSKAAMLNSAFKTLDFFNLVPGNSALLCLSCNYIAGKMMVVRAFAGNLNLIPVPVTSHPLIKLEQSIDFAALTPMQINNEINSPKKKTGLLNKVILGGSPVSMELSKKLQQQNFQAWETYGMTETLSHIALRRVNGAEASALFRPLKNVSLAKDKRGCLVINAPEISGSPIISNDLADIHTNGEFRIKGRIDNIINTGGVKVSPEEVEAKIAHLIDSPFLISSLPHSVLGNEMVLVVEDAPHNEIELWADIKKILPTYLTPKRIITKNPLPRTSTGKIKRKDIF